MGPILFIIIGAWLSLTLPITSKPQPGLRGNLDFLYDPASHFFAAITLSKCYIAPLTHEEREHVRNRVGLQEIELRMMREWVGVLNETMVYHSDSNLPELIGKKCQRQDIILVQRTIPSEPSGTSLIG